MSLTWNDVKSELEKCPNPKSVLLGNGFTIAFIDDKNFNQKKIIDKVHKYFKNRKSTRKITNIEDYISEVEKQFIEQLHKILPEEKINKLLGDNAVTPFLNLFDNFYTLNYDHVLYYLLMGMLDSKYTTDGFLPNRYRDGTLTWDKEYAQCVYYLHGAFHIKMSDNGRVEKITSNEKLNLFKNIREE